MEENLRKFKMTWKESDIIRNGLNEITEEDIKMQQDFAEYPESFKMMVHELQDGFSTIPMKVLLNEDQVEFIKALFYGTDNEELINQILR